MSGATDLDQIAERYDPADPGQFDHYLKRLHIRCITRWLHGHRVLELGSATGESTRLLAPHCTHLDVVEGSARNAEQTRRREPTATVTHALWEDFTPTAPYTDIVCAGGLEHATDPDGLLRTIIDWLTPGGRLHVTVPNGWSLHRLVGVEMDVIGPGPLYLSDGDRTQGHLRNYTPATLAAAIRAAGFTLVEHQPVFLKLVPNAEMVGWTWQRILAIHEVARRFPDNSAEIYMVAER